ncbi:MAG: hypothetical protein WDO19_14925 [Bacteroidota bacterium]
MYILILLVLCSSTKKVRVDGSMNLPATATFVIISLLFASGNVIFNVLPVFYAFKIIFRDLYQYLQIRCIYNTDTCLRVGSCLW